jgi:N4-gp56 family major capsid protein
MDSPTEITRFDINDVVRTLLGNNAYTILDNIEGADKFGSAPVRSAYFCMSHTDIISDLDNVSGFQSKNAYPSPMNTLDSEWGGAGNLRFVISSVASKVESASNKGADVYNNTVCGMEAYACVEQNQYSSQFIYRPPMFDGPLALNCSVGYKFAEVPRILNDLWVVNLRSTLAN